MPGPPLKRLAVAASLTAITVGASYLCTPSALLIMSDAISETGLQDLDVLPRWERRALYAALVNTFNTDESRASRASIGATRGRDGVSTTGRIHRLPHPRTTEYYVRPYECPNGLSATVARRK